MSESRPEISIVIPTLNEETAIREVLQSIPYRELGQPEVLVVDGGSTDGTVEVAKALGARVIQQTRRGYGQAILEGARYAKGELLVVIDGDGVYDPREIPEMLSVMRSKKADIVIGSRYLGVIEPGAISPLRKFGNRLFTFMLNFFLNVKITDFYSGFRIFKSDLIWKIGDKVSEPAQYSIILSAYKRSSRIVEAPITFYPRLGKSNMNTLSNGLRIVRLILKEGVVGIR